MRFEYTVTAKTVDEAYKKAIDLYSSLGEISMEEVINRGKKGFLGIGAVNAEIRISVDDGKEEKKPEAKKVQKNDTPAKKDARKSEKPQPKKQDNTVSKAERVPQPSQSAKQEAPKKGKRSQRPVQTIQTEEPEKERIKDEDIHVTAAEKQVVIDFLNKFIKDINFNCVAEGDVTPDENGYVTRKVDINGDDASALIGHHGETLDAIQYLANLCLARKFDGDHKEYVKVVVDIGGYRAKREESLRALARRMGEKALKYKRNVLLEPMNAYERRIIHSEIQTMEGISTHSVGYDENRKIVITYDGKDKRN